MLLLVLHRKLQTADLIKKWMFLVPGNSLCHYNSLIYVLQKLLFVIEETKKKRLSDVQKTPNFPLVPL
jgi:hypothetical protein